MIIKGLLDEDFVNYKTPCMYICTAKCSFKCDIENQKECCQNSVLAFSGEITIDDDKIIQRYLSNDITNAICFSGLEPFDQFDELRQFIDKLRNEYKANDTVIIYSGYNEDEISEYISQLKKYSNIIVKFGRYIPDEYPHIDNVLGVKLASNNQYAIKIS